jgi:transcriptional regulator with XRE-family HTH domain/Tfp pilus assembly protein PilF
MPDQLAAAARRTAAPLRPTLGDRVRQLRIAQGLTQTELAGDRFSKEYVSQIERGKTRPTAETLEWLAARLGVDRTFLETGVSSTERDRVESVIVRAEATLEAHQYAEVIPLIAGVADALKAVSAPELELRALRTVAWARMYEGGVREAVKLLEGARTIAESAAFSDVDRADVLFRLGACRYKLSSIGTAVGLLTEALELADRSGLPCDRLRSLILEWRARCFQHQRDWVAAREDVERALELAEGVNDRYAMAQAHFQASVIAERNGRWVLARSHAERAKNLYEEIAHRANVGKLLNNLGGLNFLLGKPEEAKAYLKDAFRVALDVGSDMDAAYAVSSLAQVHLRTGELTLAEEQARHALELLGAGEDVHVLQEVGNAQLVLGRALLQQERLDEAEQTFALAEETFSQVSLTSQLAAAWIAQGDLAARRGDDRKAARLYRRAAESLQDFRF